MSFENVTTVYVRVNLPSRAVIGVSPNRLVSRNERPVFQVAANHSRLDYYIVETNNDATHGITVRGATLAEQAEADAKLAANLEKAQEQSRFQKGIQIKDFYDICFISRFYARGFYSTLETLAAAEYEGTDLTMVNDVVPKAKKINQAYNEWRHTVCQPVISDMFTNADQGPDLNDEYREQVQDELDAFLTAREFDIAVYHR